MFKAITLSAVAALSAIAITPAAQANPYDGYGRSGGGYGNVYYGGDRGYNRGYGNRGYGNRGYYGGGRGYYADRGYRGNRGYYRGRRCGNGTTGTILGAIAGGLLGNEIGNGRYDRGDGTGGAIVGAGVGALAGRAIGRSC